MPKWIEITLVDRATKEPYQISRRAVVRGEWALHESINLSEDWLAFTHLPSGMVVDWIETDNLFAVARALRSLAALPPCPVPAETVRAHIGKFRLLGPAYAVWVGAVGAATAPVRDH